MMDCVICDMDGTLVDNTHRLHFLNEKPKLWTDFFDAIPGDSPHMPAILICRGLAKINVPVIICSGRPESHRRQTVEQLQKFEVPHIKILMREKGDGRIDEFIKKDMLDYIREIGFRPIFAIDDRPTVIKMWKSNGVPVLIVHNTSWDATEGSPYENPLGSHRE